MSILNVRKWCRNFKGRTDVHDEQRFEQNDCKSGRSNTEKLKGDGLGAQRDNV